MAKAARILWPVTLALIVFQAAYYYSFLPEEIASHFDLSGNPDGWMSIGHFYVIWTLVVVITNIWLPLVRVLFRRIPPSLLSIPNKEYWLVTEDRKMKAMVEMRTTMKMVFTLTNLLFVLLFQHTVLLSLGGSSSMLPLSILLYMALLIPAIVYHYRRFRVPES